MNLTIGSGAVVEHLERSSITKALSTLEPREGEDFAILGHDEMTYIQVAGNLEDGFHFEYQDGSLENHYSSREPVSLEKAVDILCSYRDGSSEWRSAVRWNPIAVEVELRSCAAAVDTPFRRGVYIGSLAALLGLAGIAYAMTWYMSSVSPLPWLPTFIAIVFLAIAWGLMFASPIHRFDSIGVYMVGRFNRQIIPWASISRAEIMFADKMPTWLVLETAGGRREHWLQCRQNARQIVTIIRDSLPSGRVEIKFVNAPPTPNTMSGHDNDFGIMPDQDVAMAIAAVQKIISALNEEAAFHPTADDHLSSASSDLIQKVNRLASQDPAVRISAAEEIVGLCHLRVLGDLYIRHLPAAAWLGLLGDAARACTRIHQ